MAIRTVCACVCVHVCYSEKDYTDGMSDDETLSGVGSVSEEIEGKIVTVSSDDTGDLSKHVRMYFDGNFGLGIFYLMMMMMMMMMMLVMVGQQGSHPTCTKTWSEST